MQNDLYDILSLFSIFDMLALAVILFAWGFMGWFIERERTHTPSTHSLITNYRYQWMTVMLTREPRIFDTAILSTLRQGASFFTSASMIAIGGGVALLGQADRLQGVAADISGDLAAPRVVWEAKIIVVILILSSAFLKFVWSHRLFGYCAVVMAAVPEKDIDEDAKRTARKAAKLNIFAARSFNRGLRTMYFALASLAWLLGPVALLASTSVTVFVLYQREFNSQSREALLED